MTFTTDWFSGHASVWEAEDGPLGSLLRRARTMPVSALEIGVWEGRSTVWLLERLCAIPGSRLVSVDHFDSGETEEGRARFGRVLHNTRSLAALALELRPGWSSDVLTKLRHEERVFDLAYIDGSHHRLDTMEDAISAWRCLRDGGVLIFDDYGEARGVITPAFRAAIV
jgi:predicted O-methyltransferase YrrM